MKLEKGDIVLDRWDGLFVVLSVLQCGELAEVRRWGSSQILHLVLGDWGDSRGLRKLIQWAPKPLVINGLRVPRQAPLVNPWGLIGYDAQQATQIKATNH